MATEAWFDYNVYMSNKLAQMKTSDPSESWNMDKLVQAFNNAGFTDAEGAQQHFLQFGADEAVAPNAFFNADEYYEAKAAELYNKDPKDVTELETANMKAAIHNAGMNAWTHYQQFGTSEGVNPSNAFNTSAYMEAKLAAMQTAEPDKGWTMEMLNKAFQDAGLSALEHFALFGGKGAGEVAESYDPAQMPPAFAVPEDQKVTPGGGGAASGETYILTPNMDVLAGTSGDDTFFAAVADGTKPTLTVGDDLDGGAGRDTLKILSGSGSLTHVAAKNIETFEFDSYTFDSANTPSIDASQHAGLDTITLKNTTSTSALQLDGLTDNFTLNLVGAVNPDSNNVIATAKYADSVAVADISATNLSTKGYIEAQGKDLTAVNLNGNTVKDGILGFRDTGTVDTVKTVNIDSTGGKFLIDASTKVSTVDASASTGAVVLGLETIGVTGADEMTILGGKGDDTILISNDLLGGKLHIDGGEGDNTLQVTYLATGTQKVGVDVSLQYDVLNAAKNISDITFNLDGDSTPSGGKGPSVTDPTNVENLQIDMSKLDATHITLRDSATVSNLSNLDFVSVTGDRTVKMSGETTIDTLNLTALDKGETVTVHSDSRFGTLNVDGVGDVSFTNSGNISAKFNAANLDGNLTYVACASPFRPGMPLT